MTTWVRVYGPVALGDSATTDRELEPYEPRPLRRPAKHGISVHLLCVGGNGACHIKRVALNGAGCSVCQRGGTA